MTSPVYTSTSLHPDPSVLSRPETAVISEWERTSMETNVHFLCVLSRLQQPGQHIPDEPELQRPGPDLLPLHPAAGSGDAAALLLGTRGHRCSSKEQTHPESWWESQSQLFNLLNRVFVLITTSFPHEPDPLSSAEPLNHPLLSGSSSFTKHATVLTSSIRDGFTNIGRDAPGKLHSFYFNNWLFFSCVVSKQLKVISLSSSSCQLLAERQSLLHEASFIVKSSV